MIILLACSEQWKTSLKIAIVVKPDHNSPFVDRYFPFETKHLFNVTNEEMPKMFNSNLKRSNVQHQKHLLQNENLASTSSICSKTCSLEANIKQLTSFPFGFSHRALEFGLSITYWLN